MSETLCTLRTKGGGGASLKDYAFMLASSDGTRSVNRGYTSNSNVFTVAETAGSRATNTITVLEAGNYEYMAETANRSVANCYVKIGDVTVSVGATTSAAGNIYIQANTVCTVYTAPASGALNTATLTLIKK